MPQLPKVPKVPEFVRSDPSMWEAVYADPSVPLDRSLVRLIIDDQRRWTRRWLYPYARFISRVLVAVLSLIKRVVPGRWMTLGRMDALCLWFLRNFVAADAVELLIRHFVVETNLVNFIIRNTEARIDPVTLRPTTLAGLGDNAVVEHDINVYDVLIALEGVQVDAPDQLDFTGIDVPKLDPERRRPRLLRMDIQTALCLMNIPFCMALSLEEFRRAIHSLRFDDSFLEILALICEDDTFKHWKMGALSLWMDTNVDVPQLVYRHALVCEYAHAHLSTLAAKAA